MNRFVRSQQAGACWKRTASSNLFAILRLHLSFPMCPMGKSIAGVNSEPSNPFTFAVKTKRTSNLSTIRCLCQTCRRCLLFPCYSPSLFRKTIDSCLPRCLSARGRISTRMHLSKGTLNAFLKASSAPLDRYIRVGTLPAAGKQRRRAEWKYKLQAPKNLQTPDLKKTSHYERARVFCNLELWPAVLAFCETALFALLKSQSNLEVQRKLTRAAIAVILSSSSRRRSKGHHFAVYRLQSVATASAENSNVSRH